MAFFDAGFFWWGYFWGSNFCDGKKFRKAMGIRTTVA
jgi:hypothetical protein